MPEETKKTWTAEGMSQHDFMLKDECLVLNYDDEVIGADNKYNVHKFIAGQPKGVVHRAFSVMLFDADGKLLLQQRAAGSQKHQPVLRRPSQIQKHKKRGTAHQTKRVSVRSGVARSDARVMCS